MKIKYDTPFELISNEFKKSGIPVLLIGGFAINFYKVSRETADIDFLINKNDYDKVREILTGSGYDEIYSEMVFARFSNESDQLHFLDIDFMLVDHETLAEMIKNGKEITLAKNIFTVPSLNHLLALKLHSIKHNPEQREYKDLLDILNLVKENNVDFKSKEFEKLCLKYGTKTIFEKIISILK